MRSIFDFLRITNIESLKLEVPTRVQDAYYSIILASSLKI